jgi:PhnB protein
MTERALVDRLDETIDTVIARADATGALRDPELAPLARIAADLRHYPSPDFKARLRARLERRTTMTAATPTMTAVREGFTTVTPYIRVPEAGLADFLAQVFDAQETFSGSGGGGGMHREVRVGDSMVMIGEGGAGGGDVMPIRPVAFHVFVNDVDAAYARAIAAGATPLGEPEDRPYGERSGYVADRFGNRWFIATALGPQSVASALRTVTPFIYAPRAADYIEFMREALGAVEEIRHEEGGQFRYGRLRIDDAAIELSEGDALPGSYMLYVADPDTRYERAVAAGATSIMPLTDQPYGRVGGVEDALGNQWFFSRPGSNESQRRAEP